MPVTLWNDKALTYFVLVMHFIFRLIIADNIEHAKNPKKRTKKLTAHFPFVVLQSNKETPVVCKHTKKVRNLGIELS
ncbi:hypothetical protein QFX18_17765 [Saccharophagus degradans]|uniref:hypothetical protein n=1 Tax=Saccharophagus degradans TaxID=86304 RepID=UPI002477DF91|nr:hypothetical protein [Saccharophagus degradans]WGO97859.1 hypothetical protein QFX18_17765 [Saccharophagus degradans]